MTEPNKTANKPSEAENAKGLLVVMVCLFFAEAIRTLVLAFQTIIYTVFDILMISLIIGILIWLYWSIRVLVTALRRRKKWGDHLDLIFGIHPSEFSTHAPDAQIDDTAISRPPPKSSIHPSPHPEPDLDDFCTELDSIVSPNDRTASENPLSQMSRKATGKTQPEQQPKKEVLHGT